MPSTAERKILDESEANVPTFTEQVKKNIPAVVIIGAQIPLAVVMLVSARGLFSEILKPQSRSASQALRLFSLLGGVTSTMSAVIGLQECKSQAPNLPPYIEGLLIATTGSLTAKLLYGTDIVPTFRNAILTYGAIELAKTGFSFFKQKTVNQHDATQVPTQQL